ncbi:MAG: hypothetical protein RJB26_1824 [Pseudomonadota bacterium]|jgi:hypothetical protein
MSTRKQRGDSTLKTLPEERQAQLAQHLAGHTLAETRAWLAADGIRTSLRALSEFHSWYALRAQLSRNESAVEALMTQLRSEQPDWTPEQVEQAGQSFFTALALQQQDPKAWAMTQQVQLKRQQLALDREKFQRETCELFLQWSQDERAKAIANSPSSHAEKLDQLYLTMFGKERTA